MVSSFFVTSLFSCTPWGAWNEAAAITSIIKRRTLKLPPPPRRRPPLLYRRLLLPLPIQWATITGPSNPLITDLFVLTLTLPVSLLPLLLLLLLLQLHQHYKYVNTVCLPACLLFISFHSIDERASPLWHYSSSFPPFVVVVESIGFSSGSHILHYPLMRNKKEPRWRKRRLPNLVLVVLHSLEEALAQRNLRVF